MRSLYGMNSILKNSKKVWIVSLFLIVLCGCLEEPETDRSNRKNVSSSRITATPVPATPTPTATPSPKPSSTKRSTPTPTCTPTQTCTPTPTPVPYIATEEILGAEEYSGKVQIADTVLTLPCRLGEIMKISGIGLSQSKYSSLDGYDPLYDIYKPGSRNTLVMVFTDGSEAELEVENLSLVSLPLEELYVTELTSESPCIFFPKGVCVGVHCEILKEWKEYDNLVAGSERARYQYYEAEYEMDYSGKREIGAEYEVYVNNATYNIEEVHYIPTFYVNIVQTTEVTKIAYPKNLKFELPIALNDSWKAGLIVYDNRYFVVEHETSYLYDHEGTVDTPEKLLARLGRDLEYYNTEGWEGWKYYLDTSEKTNKKVIVQNNETICSVINAWDYSDVAGENGVMIDGMAMFPKEDSWKYYAEVGVMYGGYVDLWMFSVGALDKGEIPEEVRSVFWQVVQQMAESMTEYEKK